MRTMVDGSAVSGYAEWWGYQESEPWDEEEAIRLIQEACAEVTMYEEGGARMANREEYHARIEVAHEARNMEAYREAINGYTTAAREAHRLKAQQESRRKDT